MYIYIPLSGDRTALIRHTSYTYIHIYIYTYIHIYIYSYIHIYIPLSGDRTALIRLRGNRRLKVSLFVSVCSGSARRARSVCAAAPSPPPLSSGFPSPFPPPTSPLALAPGAGPEECASVKRGLRFWQKSPINMAKETYQYGKRDLLMEKRPIHTIADLRYVLVS